MSDPDTAPGLDRPRWGSADGSDVNKDLTGSAIIIIISKRLELERTTNSYVFRGRVKIFSHALAWVMNINN